MKFYFADQVAIGGRKNINPVAAAGPDAAIHVALDAIGDAIGDVGKDGAARKRVAGGHGINLDAMPSPVSESAT